MKNRERKKTNRPPFDVDIKRIRNDNNNTEKRNAELEKRSLKMKN